MRLKSIKLAGFKSFVDPTDIPLPQNLTAVVGPNGCGKSNVIDAVRWVMGESSAKHLRGESMTDVIFNGSNGRKPVAQASVELVFDNREGRLGGNYAAYDEIAVKRLVTRDGQSTYFMNGARCRRKDITDLFLGTGLGPRSYAIIEQGMISQLIEAKPDDLRVFIEEAAGISKYKERRRETAQRMRRTEENLERLQDIRDELGRQLEKLEKQAADAQLYTEHKSQQRQLQAELTAIRWRKLNNALTQYDQEILDFEVNLEGAYAQRISAEKDIESYREQHHEVNERYQSVQTKYYEMGTNIARVEQQIQHMQERQSSLATDQAQAQDTLSQSKSHTEEDQVRQQEIQELLGNMEPELEILDAQFHETQEHLERSETDMQAWQAAWDEYSQNSAEPREQAQVQQSKIGHLEESIQRYRERYQRLEKESEGLTWEPMEAEIDTLKAEQEEVQSQLEVDQEALQAIQSSMQTQRDTNQSTAKECDKIRSLLQKDQGKLTSLEALQQAALGDNDQEQQSWLKEQGLENAPQLISQIKTQPGWEMALEIVLGSYVQTLIGDDLSQSITKLSESPSTLVILESTSNDSSLSEAGSLSSVGLPKLFEKVTSSVGNLPWLHEVYCAENLETALEYQPKLSAESSIITSEGVWLGKHWLRVSKTIDVQQGVLQRQEKITQLTEQIESGLTRSDELDEMLSVGRESLQEYEAQKEESYENISQQSRNVSELGSQVSAKQVRCEQIKMRRDRLSQDRRECESHIRTEQTQLSQARLALEKAIEIMGSQEDQKETLVAQKDEVKIQLDNARDQARDTRDRMHELSVQVKSLQSEQASLETRVIRAEEQLQQAVVRLQQVEEQISGLELPDDLQPQLEEKLAARLEVEEEWLALRQEVQSLEHAIRGFEEQRQAAEQQAQQLRTTLEQKRLRRQTDQVQKENLEKQAEEMEVELEQVVIGVPEEATENNWDNQIKALQRDVEALGPINLAAIDEFSAQKQRKTYLDEQFTDLTTALETLTNAIEKIDMETRERFKETFDKVNSGLQELFPKVFGGGSAYLDLTGEDLLDTGVTIMARPPGKRNSTIHLLSGGEKALTAIALVFSIFRLNPAPFCMLDEVDAPLDDSNVGRYSRLVEEMSKTVQFIYISHNKIAMEMANQLMGVTMHEPGVSRIVSVDIEEAAAMAV